MSRQPYQNWTIRLSIRTQHFQSTARNAIRILHSLALTRSFPNDDALLVVTEIAVRAVHAVQIYLLLRKKRKFRKHLFYQHDDLSPWRFVFSFVFNRCFLPFHVCLSKLPCVGQCKGSSWLLRPTLVLVKLYYIKQ